MLLLLLIICGALIGGAIGSFLSCAAFRLPRKISLGGRSFCPACGEDVPSLLNLPVVGWLMLRGRAHCCGAALPKGMLAYELAAAGLGAGLVAAVALLAGPESSALFLAPAGLLVLALVTLAGALAAERFAR